MLPGFTRNITLTRQSVTGQDAIGMPSKTADSVWTKKGFYGNPTNDFNEPATGFSFKDKFNFYLPPMPADDIPNTGDILTADGMAYIVETIILDAISHHIEVMARRFER
jgi:hypothetical protein